MRSISLTPPLLALSITIPVSVWWFAQLSLVSPLPGPTLAPMSLQALQTLVSFELACLCLFGPLWILSPRIDSGSTLLSNSIAVISFVVPPLPLLGMLSYASGSSLLSLAFAVLGVAAVGVAVLGITQLVLRQAGTSEAQRLAVTCSGALAAVAVWSSRSVWLHWISP